MKILERGNIKVNKARCLKCNQDLESDRFNVFQSCKCGNVCVEGGKEVIRHAIFDESNYENLSEYFD